MAFRVVGCVSVGASIGVAWIIESGAADSFREATRQDFQKIPLGIAGIENLGGSESPEARVKLGTRIEDVLCGRAALAGLCACRFAESWHEGQSSRGGA